MTDPIQILLAVVVTALTIMLIIVGIELLRVLKEARKTMERTNRILDDVETISSSVSGPVSKFSNLIQGMQQGASVINTITRILDKRFGKSEKSE